MKKEFNFKKGFTLAEVLITLVIIGIVAAVTIPSVISRHKEKVIVTKVKKMYSLLQEGFKLAVIEEGTPDSWGIEGRDSANKDPEAESYEASQAIAARNILFKHLKVLKYCNNAYDGEDCGMAKEYLYRNGAQDGGLSGSSSIIASLSLIDGSALAIMANGTGGKPQYRGPGALEHTYGTIFFDINGTKGPNLWGDDVFSFYITDTEILPVGLDYETLWPFSGCYTHGVGCTAWVILNENRDYLKCDDLSWHGKKTCN